MSHYADAAWLPVATTPPPKDPGIIVVENERVRCLVCGKRFRKGDRVRLSPESGMIPHWSHERHPRRERVIIDKPGAKARFERLA